MNRILIVWSLWPLTEMELGPGHLDGSSAGLGASVPLAAFSYFGECRYNWGDAGGFGWFSKGYLCGF